MEELNNSTEQVQGVDELDFDSLIQDVPEQQPVEENPQTGGGDPQGEQAIKTQADFNNALKTRLAEKERSVSRRYENSPEYLLGQQLLRERMTAKGISADAAMQEIQNEFVQQKAAKYKTDPQSFYEDYIRNQNQPIPANNRAQSLAEELAEAKESGILPDYFEPSNIDSEFLANCERYGVEAAAKIFAAGHASTDGIVSELTARQKQAQPMRTTGNDRPNTKLDFDNMSADQFDAFDRRVQQAIAQGRKIRF